MRKFFYDINEKLKNEPLFILVFIIGLILISTLV